MAEIDKPKGNTGGESGGLPDGSSLQEALPIAKRQANIEQKVQTDATSLLGAIDDSVANIDKPQEAKTDARAERLARVISKPSPYEIPGANEPGYSADPIVKRENRKNKGDGDRQTNDSDSRVNQHQVSALPAQLDGVRVLNETNRGTKPVVDNLRPEGASPQLMRENLPTGHVQPLDQHVAGAPKETGILRGTNREQGIVRSNPQETRPNTVVANAALADLVTETNEPRRSQAQIVKEAGEPRRDSNVESAEVSRNNIENQRLASPTIGGDVVQKVSHNPGAQSKEVARKSEVVVDAGPIDRPRAPLPGAGTQNSFADGRGTSISEKGTTTGGSATNRDVGVQPQLDAGIERGNKDVQAPTIKTNLSDSNAVKGSDGVAPTGTTSGAQTERAPKAEVVTPVRGPRPEGTGPSEAPQQGTREPGQTGVRGESGTPGKNQTGVSNAGDAQPTTVAQGERGIKADGGTPAKGPQTGVSNTGDAQPTTVAQGDKGIRTDGGTPAKGPQTNVPNQADATQVDGTKQTSVGPKAPNGNSGTGNSGQADGVAESGKGQNATGTPGKGQSATGTPGKDGGTGGAKGSGAADTRIDPDASAPPGTAKGNNSSPMADGKPSGKPSSATKGDAGNEPNALINDGKTIKTNPTSPGSAGAGQAGLRPDPREGKEKPTKQVDPGTHVGGDKAGKGPGAVDGGSKVTGKRGDSSDPTPAGDKPGKGEGVDRIEKSAKAESAGRGDKTIRQPGLEPSDPLDIDKTRPNAGKTRSGSDSATPEKGSSTGNPLGDGRGKFGEGSGKGDGAKSAAGAKDGSAGASEKGPSGTKDGVQPTNKAETAGTKDGGEPKTPIGKDFAQGPGQKGPFGGKEGALGIGQPGTSGGKVGAPEVGQQGAFGGKEGARGIGQSGTSGGKVGAPEVGQQGAFGGKDGARSVGQQGSSGGKDGAPRVGQPGTVGGKESAHEVGQKAPQGAKEGAQSPGQQGTIRVNDGAHSGVPQSSFGVNEVSPIGKSKGISGGKENSQDASKGPKEDPKSNTQPVSKSPFEPVSKAGPKDGVQSERGKQSTALPQPENPHATMKGDKGPSAKPDQAVRQPADKNDGAIRQPTAKTDAAGAGIPLPGMHIPLPELGIKWTGKKASNPSAPASSEPGKGDSKGLADAPTKRTLPVSGQSDTRSGAANTSTKSLNPNLPTIKLSHGDKVAQILNIPLNTRAELNPRADVSPRAEAGSKPEAATKPLSVLNADGGSRIDLRLNSKVEQAASQLTQTATVLTVTRRLVGGISEVPVSNQTVDALKLSPRLESDITRINKFNQPDSSVPKSKDADARAARQMPDGKPSNRIQHGDAVTGKASIAGSGAKGLEKLALRNSQDQAADRGLASDTVPRSIRDVFLKFNLSLPKRSLRPEITESGSYVAQQGQSSQRLQAFISSGQHKSIRLQSSSSNFGIERVQIPSIDHSDNDETEQPGDASTKFDNSKKDDLSKSARPGQADSARKLYIVQEGDTPQTIAVVQLNDERLAVLIAEINELLFQKVYDSHRGEHVKVLPVGAMILLPNNRDIEIFRGRLSN